MYWLTVVAYDCATGARLWRKDLKPADAGDAAGLRMALAPDGSLVVTGQALRGFLDWYTVAPPENGAPPMASRARWRAEHERDSRSGTCVAGRHDRRDRSRWPQSSRRVHSGVTVGYGPDGTLLWEAFARMATVWGGPLVNGDVCADRADTTR